LKSDDINRLLIGLLVVGGVAGAGLYVWKFYQREKQKELAYPEKRRVVEVPITSAPPMVAKRKK
jgi:hypothetical protein